MLLYRVFIEKIGICLQTGSVRKIEVTKGLKRPNIKKVKAEFLVLVCFTSLFNDFFAFPIEDQADFHSVKWIGFVRRQF